MKQILGSGITSFNVEKKPHSFAARCGKRKVDVMATIVVVMMMRMMKGGGGDGGRW